MLGLFAALILFAPARWLASAVDQTSEGRILLVETLGTVWNGSARVLLTGGAGSIASAKNKMPSGQSSQPDLPKSVI